MEQRCTNNWVICFVKVDIDAIYWVIEIQRNCPIIDSERFVTVESLIMNACWWLEIQSAISEAEHHEILVNRLGHSFGIQSKVIKWRTSYLTGRTQCVHLSGKISSVESMRNGVPQGSVLGPLLFLVYTADINTTGTTWAVIAFLCRRLPTILLLSTRWHTISPRNNACQYIRYWSVDVIQSSSPQPVKDRVPVMRYLATHSSDRRWFFSCWRCRCETVAGRPKPRRDDGWQSIDDSSRQQDRRPVLLLVTKDKINLSFAVHWRYRHPCHKPDLLQNWLLQYRLCRLTEQYDRLSPACASCRCPHHHWRSMITSHLPWETKLHWLPVMQHITFKLCLTVYKALHSMTSYYIAEFCRPVTATHYRSRLHSATFGDLVVPRNRLELVKRAFAVASSTAWNNLQLSVRLAPSITTFKTALKTHLFSAAYGASK